MRIHALPILLLACLSGCDGSANSPHVIIIGDSISLGYTPYVQMQVPNVDHNGECGLLTDATAAHDNAGSSAREAACIGKWLAGQHYDIVHFNAGMHDVFVAGCAQGNTAHEVELSDYLMNLQTVIDAIRAHGAIPVFATTTPVEGAVACHSDSDIQAYNMAAVDMMRAEGVRVDDLYAAILPVQAQYHHGIHFTHAGYQRLAAVVSDFLTQPGT